MTQQDAQELAKSHIADILIKNRIVKDKNSREIIAYLQLEQDLFKDLSFDSLDSTELVMDLEKTLNVAITDLEADKLRTVEDVVNLILAHEQ